MEFREEVNQTKATAFFHLATWPQVLVSVPWAVVFICVLGSGCLIREHNGSDTILMACSPLAKVEPLMVSWSQGGSYLQFLEQ